MAYKYVGKKMYVFCLLVLHRLIGSCSLKQIQNYKKVRGQSVQII